MCFSYGVCSHLPEKQNIPEDGASTDTSAQVVAVAQKRHTHTSEAVPFQLEIHAQFY